jgi:hypothetical protein
MHEQRKNTRYHTSAIAIIKGVHDGETLLKDISVTGCRLELPAYAEIKPNEQYKLEIKPESDSKINPFHLIVESKWEGAKVDSYELGFIIKEFPHGRQFQRYVDYLSWRYDHGSSMTGDSSSEIQGINGND